MKNNNKSKVIIIILSSFLLFLLAGVGIVYALISNGYIATSEEEPDNKRDRQRNDKHDDEKDQNDDPDWETNDNSVDVSGNRNESLFSDLRTTYDNYDLNYTYNTALEEYEFNNLLPIYDQLTCPDFKIGDSLIEDVGCEIIATYNALFLIDEPHPLSDIIMSFEKNGYIMYEGTFGSDPYAIPEYLNSVSVESTEINDFSEMNSLINSHIGDGSTFIISFWNSSSFLDGVHTIALYTDPAQLHPIYLYNMNENYADTLEDVTDEECFIVGYIINP